METKVLQINECISELHFVQNFCEELMKTKHYQAMGYPGVFAIVTMAKSIGVNPLEALNGGLYYVQGKVEMRANLMNCLVRQHGHSIQQDPKCDDTICILHGKRKDNGDTWSASFSVKDAVKAGIYNERGTWGKYTTDMLYARALSRLARQLFPDVIKGCYVEGEILQAKEVEYRESHYNTNFPNDIQSIEHSIEEQIDAISDDDYRSLQTALKACGTDFTKMMRELRVKEQPNIKGWKELCPDLYKKIMKKAESFLLNPEEVVNA